MKVLVWLMASSVLLMAQGQRSDVSGKWTGKAVLPGPDGSPGEVPACLVLKQDGNRVTGTAGQSEYDQIPLTGGSVADGKVALEIKASEHQTIKLELALDGDRLKGRIVMDWDGRASTGSVELARSK